MSRCIGLILASMLLAGVFCGAALGQSTIATELQPVAGQNSTTSGTSPDSQPSAAIPVAEQGGTQTVAVAPLPAEQVLRRQSLQEQVRQMARRLIADQLREQMLQLEENGLTELPLYRELREMESHLDEIVERHMQDVVRTLETLVQSPSDEQAALFQQAREKSRTVLVHLLMERQRVLRRLRLAEIEERVRYLIERETNVQRKTETLPAEATFRRAAAVIALREDQQDVHTLFAQLGRALKEIQGWGGQVGEEAATALQGIQEAKLDALFGQSLQALEAGDFAAAVETEKQIVAALQALLERMRRLQGEFDADSAQAAKRILQDLSKRQEELRNRTLESELDMSDREQLTEEQLQLQKELAAASQKWQAPSLDQAVQAAQQAADEIFQGQTQPAVEQQQAVIERLQQAVQEVSLAEENQETSELLANLPLARTMEQELQQAKSKLEELRQKQSAASQTAKSGDLPQAARQESEISQGLAQIPQGKSLPSDVKSSIDKASEVVGQTAQTLSALVTPSASPSQGEEPTPQMASVNPADRGPTSGTQAPSQPTAQDQQGQTEPRTTPDQEGKSSDSGSAPSPQVEAKSPSPESQAHSATRRAEQAIDEAISEVETALADIARARLAGELIEAARTALQSPPDQAQQHKQVAQQRAEELRDLTQRQLAEAQSARQAVESHLPTLADETTPLLEKVGQIRQDLVEAMATQVEAMEQPEQAQALDAQKKVTEKAGQAAQALESLPPQATSGSETAPREALAALRQALDASRQAESALTDRQQPAAGAAQPLQRQSLGGLTEAAQAVDEWAARLSREAAQALAQHHTAAQKLAPPAIPVSPQATSSLHTAENHAALPETSGSRPPEATVAALPPQAGSPEAIVQKHQAAEQAFLTAAEALAEREQQLAQALAAAEKLPEELAALGQKMPPAAEGASETTAPQALDAAQMALAALQNLAQAAAAPQSAAPLAATAAAETSPSAPANQASSQSSSTATPQPSDAASASSQGGVARSGPQTQNRSSLAQPLTPSTAPMAADSRTGTQAGQQGGGEPQGNTLPPWLLQLPPEMREAIRAGMQVPPPKGYEDRFRRYFQNME